MLLTNTQVDRQIAVKNRTPPKEAEVKVVAAAVLPVVLWFMSLYVCVCCQGTLVHCHCACLRRFQKYFWHTRCL